MTYSNTPWPAYDWTGTIVVVTGGADLDPNVLSSRVSGEPILFSEPEALLVA